MSLAQVKIQFKDGGLGLVPSYPTGIPLFVGSANGSAQANTVYFLTSDEVDKVEELFGNSPLTNYILDAFSTGTHMVFATRAQDNTVGSIMTALSSAVDTVLVDGNKAFEFIVITDTGDKTLFSALNSYLTDLEQNKDTYTYALMPARGPASTETTDNWVSSLITEFSGVSSKRISVVAGRLRLVNLTGKERVDNMIGTVAGLIGKAKVNEDIGWVQKFNISPAVALEPKDLNLAHIQALDQAGFITARTYNGKKGYFVTSPKLFTDETSDYHLIEYRRVSDKAGSLIRRVLLEYARADVRAPIDADPENPPDPSKSPTVKDIELRMKAVLRDEMFKNGEIYSYKVWIPEGQNIWSTKKLTVKYKIAPNPILVYIEGEFKFFNPFLGG